MGRSNSSKPIVFFVIGFTEIEIRGFQVLQVSSPHHHQLGRAWVEPRGFVVSEVSWIVRLEESSKLRGDAGLVLFSVGFRKIRFGLETFSENEEVLIRLIRGQAIFPGNSTFLIPASKLSRCCSLCCRLIAQKSSTNKPALGHRVAIATVGLLRSPSCPGNGFCTHWFHYSASQATCPDKGAKQTSEYSRKLTAFHSRFNSYKIQVIELTDHADCSSELMANGPNHK